MASNGKNKETKKYKFKEGSNPLFPISNKTPNPIKNFSAIKLNFNLDSNKQSKKLSSNYINLNHNSSAIKIYKNGSKAFSSSRPKQGNPLLKFNNSKLTKIKPLEFPKYINDSGIVQKYRNIYNSNKKSNLSVNKERNKTEINLDVDSTKDYIKNINFISPKNLRNSQFINNNNMTYNLKKPAINRNITEINNSNNNSYYNNIIINNNSFLDINHKLSEKNFNLKNEKIERTIKSPKGTNVKLIFNNKNIAVNKKNEDPPIILKRKDSNSLPLSNTSKGNNFKISIDKNIFNGEYKLHLKRSKKNIFTENNNIINNFVNVKNDEKLGFDNSLKTKKKNIHGPEELHFYFIKGIQDGKKTEKDFEKD